jgi:hypothetical protein
MPIASRRPLGRSAVILHLQVGYGCAINWRKPCRRSSRMYDVLVFDHRLAEHWPLDSKSELARLLFGYTTDNGQRFPAQPELVRFVVRPGKDTEDDETDMTGREAIAHAQAGKVIRFVYRAEGRRTEGSLARIGGGHLRVR